MHSVTCNGNQKIIPVSLCYPRIITLALISIPCFLFQIQIPFDRYFRVEALQQYHRVMTMELFMSELAPEIWPPGNRTGNVCGSVGICNNNSNNFCRRCNDK